jgi:uncharacterized protein YndB with AHSA1/START domain
MDIEVNVRERVLQRIGKVFAALIDPREMAHYFISGASGPMKAGAAVDWEFADVDAKLSVDVIDVEENRQVIFDWSACGPKTRVTIKLAADDPTTTVVTINESRFPMDEDGVKRALGQNAGWTYTLCCLKAYLQHGVNLRQGLNKRITDV